MDTTPSPFDAIPRFEVRPPHGHLYRVEVQIIGLALVHRWTGFADDEDKASHRGYVDARRTFRHYGLCVRSVERIGV